MHPSAAKSSDRDLGVAGLHSACVGCEEGQMLEGIGGAYKGGEVHRCAWESGCERQL